MATVTSSEVGTDDQAVDRVGLIAVKASYSVPATGDGSAANDVIQMVKVPAGASIIDLWLSSTDIDTDASPAVILHVGDGGDADRYIASSTVGQAGGVARLSAIAGVNYTYTADDTIDVTIGTVAATKAAGTLVLTVLYVTSAGTGGGN
jgi:hypothetical protein